MDLARLHRRSECEWEIAPTGKMRVPAVIYATEPLIRDMDDKVFEQVTNVAALPGIVQASYAMPDAHWGYGFPIGGVAAFDPDRGGVLSAGGVGFDISCGVRTLCTGLTVDDIPPVKEHLADALFRHIPAGVGSTGRLHLNRKEMDEMLTGGARWAVERRYGTREDLERTERLRGGPGLPGRYAPRHELRLGEPPGHHASRAGDLRRGAPPRRAHLAVRRVAQHVQSGRARRERRRETPVHPSQGRDPRLRAWPPGCPGALPGRRSAGLDRRGHWHRRLHSFPDRGKAA